MHPHISDIILVSVFAGIALFGLTIDGGIVLVIFGLLGVGLGIGSTLYRTSKLKMNHKWYIEKHPDCKLGHGKVKCFSCGGSHITVRNKMNKTYIRAHICVNCGETLYYSPEK